MYIVINNFDENKMKQLFHFNDYLTIFIQIIENAVTSRIYYLSEDLTSESFHTQPPYFSYFLLYRDNNLQRKSIFTSARSNMGSFAWTTVKSRNDNFN